MFIIKGSWVGYRIKQHVGLLWQIAFLEHWDLVNCFIVAPVPLATFTLHITIIVSVVETTHVMDNANELVFWCQTFKVVVKQFLRNFKFLVEFDLWYDFAVRGRSDVKSVDMNHQNLRKFVEIHCLDRWQLLFTLIKIYSIKQLRSKFIIQ